MIIIPADQSQKGLEVVGPNWEPDNYAVIECVGSSLFIGSLYNSHGLLVRHVEFWIKDSNGKLIEWEKRRQLRSVEMN